MPVLPLKRGLNSQPLALPAGARRPDGSFLRLAHPQASWVTFGWNLFAYLGLARLLLESRLPKARTTSLISPCGKRRLSGVRSAGVLCLCAPGQREGGCAPQPAPASSQPGSRQGREGPLSVSLTRETQRDKDGPREQV